MKMLDFHRSWVYKHSLLMGHGIINIYEYWFLAISSTGYFKPCSPFRNTPYFFSSNGRHH
ncbi:MAG: hypothetical protein LC437_09005 [Thiohalomonas sp.]|nr:hypothetical protein [Thiohalomonas sp.]